MTVHQLWRFPRGEENPINSNYITAVIEASAGLQQLSSEQISQLHELIWRYHTHSVLANQCCSMVIQRIRAPVHYVWPILRRFDYPQAYKHFIRRCSMNGDGRVGSTREVEVVSGLPAASSTERLEILDEEHHILSFRIVGGQHRLRNYRSITTLHELEVDRKPATIVIESYVVDVPHGNTVEDTKIFADTIVKCNLQSLAKVSELQARATA